MDKATYINSCSIFKSYLFHFLAQKNVLMFSGQILVTLVTPKKLSPPLRAYLTRYSTCLKHPLTRNIAQDTPCYI